MAEPDEDALSHIRKLLEGIREKVCRGDTERVSWMPAVQEAAGDAASAACSAW